MYIDLHFESRLLIKGFVLMLKQGDKARVVQTLLFVAGINTLLQTLFGTRLPAIVGGSFTYIIPISYIINDSSLQQIDQPHLVSCHASYYSLFMLFD